MSSEIFSNHRNVKLLRAAPVIFAVLVSMAILMTIASGEVNATAKAKTAASSSKLPSITAVSPRKDVQIGATLKLGGRNFVKGAKSMVIVFQRDGSKRRFSARAKGLSTKAATVKVPNVSSDLVRKDVVIDETPLDNQYRLLIITKYGSSKKKTNRTISPIVDANSASAVAGNLGADGDCDADGIKNGIDDDGDNDMLPNSIELTIGTEVCNPDTDGDAVTDYYEYRVAYEYNGGPTLPYPSLQPYPNPLVGDSATDFDSDRLSMIHEFRAWQFTARMDRFYSDADQDSDGDLIEDGAEDEDADLIPNGPELFAFTGGPLGGALNWLRKDTDGDGLCDGLDDQDHDGPPTAIAVADCATVVPNNGPAGNPDTLYGAGDPNPGLIDGDDNRYSNFYEWQVAGAPENSPGDAYLPCFPSGYPISPYCPAPFNPAPWGP